MKKHNARILTAVFLLNFICAAIALLPHAISNGGILTLSEDFNAETIPYYYLINNAAQSGEVFWNWNIDIGSEFGPAFSSLMCSPLTWPVFMVPESWLPYITVWILILKYAFAGLTSYLFIERYIKHKECAVLGSMLYAFSGYQAVNLVFNLFDCVAFFPLMLYALDRLVQDDKRGLFAAAVWINACASFTLFVQSAILCIIYFIIRYWLEDIRAWRHIGKCILEAIIGVGIAAAAFIPQVFAMLGNTRAAVKIPGSDYLTFDTTNVLLIIRSLLMPADAMSNGSVLVENDWTSCGTYLPMVGIILAFAFVYRNKKHWISLCLLTCLVVAFVPVLNNMFMMFSAYPYRRWFYFPVLLMALASAVFIDQGEEEEGQAIWKEAVIVLAMIVTFAVFCWSVNWDGNGGSAIKDAARFNWSVGVACIGAVAVILIWHFVKATDRGLVTLAGVFLACILTTSVMVSHYQLPSAHGPGVDGGNNPKDVTNELFNSVEMLEDVEVWPYRMVAWNNYYNYSMIINKPTRMSFHSIVDNSISELYEMLGTPRETAITPYGPTGTDELLSTKYFMLNYELNSERLQKIDEVDNGTRMIYLYEDGSALPLGFTYDLYMTRSEFLTHEVEDRAAIMLRVLVVKDEDVNRVEDVLTHYDPEIHGIITRADIGVYLRMHLEECCTNHQKTNRGDFTATLISGAEKYAFFSVPYSSKWNVTVNGEKAEILNINGLMAIRVQEGENTISFYYSMTINRVSVAISIVFAMLLIVYCIMSARKAKLTQ